MDGNVKGKVDYANISDVVSILIIQILSWFHIDSIIPVI